MSRLVGKVALITGAGMGMGREASLLFAEHGARVIVVDINREAASPTHARSPLLPCFWPQTSLPI